MAKHDSFTPLVPTQKELELIKAETLETLVRPFEEQPKQVKISSGLDNRLLPCWQLHNCYWPLNSNPLNEITRHAPHQIGDVLAVAEEWREYKPDLIRWSSRPPETMPPGLAEHHVEITGIWPMRVTKLARKEIDQLGYRTAYDVYPFFEFTNDWNATYPTLPFDKGPWAWFYSCKMKGVA